MSLPEREDPSLSLFKGGNTTGSSLPGRRMSTNFAIVGYNVSDNKLMVLLAYVYMLTCCICVYYFNSEYYMYFCAISTDHVFRVNIKLF